MLLPDFNYHKPKTLTEAYNLLSSNSNAALMAGGTDLLVEIKQGIRKFDNIISLNYIEELNYISEDENFVYIGSAVTFQQIQKSDIIKKNIPVLIDAVSQIGSHQVRNAGTIGGNLCTCASCADSAPILVVYNAEVVVGSADGDRRILLTDFQLHHHQTSISSGEILTKIIINKQNANFYSSFSKFGLRESSSISVASVAVGMTVENSIVINPAIAVGACAPTPILCHSAASILTGKDVGQLKGDNLILSEISDAAAKEITPIDDIRGSADYRREIVRTLTKNTILDALSNYKI